MDDYYSLLGVDTDASVDDIRAAYRTRKDALDSASDAGKADVARLNKAWNVLSDPYQRGRYDQQRADAEEAGTLGTVEEVATAPSNGARDQRPARQPRQLGPPTLTLPPGTRWPEQKQRLFAMAVDLLVLVALTTLGSALIVPAFVKSQKPAAVKEIDRAQKTDDAAIKTRDDAKKALDDAKKAKPVVPATVDEKQRAYDSANEAEKKAYDAVTEANKKVLGLSLLATGFVFIIEFLYLVVPSARTGQTLGKRFQRLRVVRQDGERLRLGDAIRRYGPLILAGFATVALPGIGIFIFLIALWGVISWTRNNNQQGWHDRLAHTIVVSDAA